MQNKVEIIFVFEDESHIPSVIMKEFGIVLEKWFRIDANLKTNIRIVVNKDMPDDNESSDSEKDLSENAKDFVNAFSKGVSDKMEELKITGVEINRNNSLIYMEIIEKHNALVEQFNQLVEILKNSNVVLTFENGKLVAEIAKEQDKLQKEGENKQPKK